jgi:hypothetical protein
MHASGGTRRRGNPGTCGKNGKGRQQLKRPLPRSRRPRLRFCRRASRLALYHRPR